MNEAETRAEYIDPQLKASGWGIVEETRIMREYKITAGKIKTGGGREKPLIADYILVYRGRKLAVIEAKSYEREVGEGVAQAKNYAEKLKIAYTFSTNGREIYQISMETGTEGLVPSFPTPVELWNKVFPSTTRLSSSKSASGNEAVKKEWREKFDRVPFEDIGGTKDLRYYQEIAVNKTMAAIAEEKPRILLTMATGTGKTFIAFQIVWKLYQARWNLLRDGARRPRVLFLADRNILANQAYNAFSAFPEDALVRISPEEIRKKGSVPTNGTIFFTIFQTFMCGSSTTRLSSPKSSSGTTSNIAATEPVEVAEPKPVVAAESQAYFGDYTKDFFDLIIIDECHRGGANDESNWREIMEYFSPAVQLGLTATPKRKDNVDTYKYFGEPVYIYSLKDGINDGFLTPFKVKRIKTTLDDYIYTTDDMIIEGEIEEGKIYKEPDFNRIIEIKQREAKRVQIFLSQINQNEKSIVFCATQDHAAAVRDLVNQYKASAGSAYKNRLRSNQATSNEPVHVNYCVRVTANDGALGEQYLREIQHMIATSYWSADGKPISAEEFLYNLFGTLPDFFKDEAELRTIWANPVTRHVLLERLAEVGYGSEELGIMQQLINAENSDLFDVLEYVSFSTPPITREMRVAAAQSQIFNGLDIKQKEFLEFVLSKYIETGVEELDLEKLPKLLELKYQAISDAADHLGGVELIRGLFLGFQRYLYESRVA